MQLFGRIFSYNGFHVKVDVFLKWVGSSPISRLVVQCVLLQLSHNWSMRNDAVVKTYTQLQMLLSVEQNGSLKNSSCNAELHS